MAIINFQVPAFDMQLTFSILASLVEQTEISIQRNIDNFRSDGVETFEIEISPEDNIYQSFDTYLGLDDQTVDLNYMFTSYFPSIQRRSVFLTIFGIMEHELEQFCFGYTKRNSLNITLGDLKGSGMERSHLYIKKMLNLNESTSFPNIKKIIKLRNACIHNDGKYINNDAQEIKEVISLMNDHPTFFKRDGKQILFLEGSLTFIISLFEGYASEIAGVA